jgi:hypothetical protein
MDAYGPQPTGADLTPTAAWKQTVAILLPGYQAPQCGAGRIVADRSQVDT